MGRQVRLVRHGRRSQPLLGFIPLAFTRSPRTGLIEECSEHLVHLGESPDEGEVRVEMSAEPEDDLFLWAFELSADGREYRHSQVRGQVDYPYVPAESAENLPQSGRVWVREPIQIDRRAADPVIPPKRDTVPLDQFKKSLEDGFL